tara:strand:- start:311 stop:418 length:108 start_codon:yes stop_codon:yes gene_type:complete
MFIMLKGIKKLLRRFGESAKVPEYTLEVFGLGEKK